MAINCWPELSANFRENFEVFLQEGRFSDVTLIATDMNGDDVKFPVHRFVLASALPYFAKMFTPPMKEADAKEIRVEGIGAEILGQLIRFLYCGEILLSRKNLREILKYADYFGIEFLVVKCTELYSNGFKMDFDLAIEIRNVWRSGGHSTLKMALKKANKYLKENFANFLHTDTFKQAEINEVVDILSWDGVCEKNEELIFNAANRWFEYDSKNRRQFAERVFGIVRLPQLSKEFLSNTVCNNRFLKGNDKFEKMIRQAIEVLSNELADRTASTRHQMEIYVFPVGERVAQKHIPRFNLAENEWSTMDLPKAISDKYDYKVVPFEKRCFVLGGRKKLNTEISQNNLIFDPFSENKICEEIGEMKMPRYQHCAFSVDGSIYVCGGFGRDDNVLSSVEHFIANDSRGWMELSEKMKQKRAMPACCVLDNIAYVCGGYDEQGNDLKSVERFDSRIGEWQNVAPMLLSSRYNAGAALLKGEIYVAGGWNDNGDPLETLEIYDQRMDAWRGGPSMSVPRYDFAFVSDEARLFAIGGSRCNSVEVFDLSVGSGDTQWTMSEEMPSISGAVRAAIF